MLFRSFGSVSFSSTLNGIGSFSGSLPSLNDPGVQKMNPVASTIPAKTALYVLRNGVCVWGGIIWNRSYDSATQTFNIAANEFLSYFQQRFVRWNANYVSRDQLQIASFQIINAQSYAYGNIGVSMGAWTPSGITRSLQYLNTDYTTVYDAINTLATMDQGFDFAIDVALSGTDPTALYFTKTFNMNYPRRGVKAPHTTWTFDIGNLISYTYNEDGTQQRTITYGVGNGTGTSMIQSQASTSALNIAGYPLLEIEEQYKDITNQAVLNALTVSAQTAYGLPLVQPVLQVQPSMDPAFGSYSIGDDVKLNLNDPRFPSGLSAYFRIMSWTCVPPDSTTQAEYVTLNLGPSVV